MENMKIKFRLRLNIDEWGGLKKGDEEDFYIDVFNEKNGLVRHPIDKRWDIISYKLVKNNGVLDDVIVCKCGNESYHIETDGFKYCKSCHKNKPY